MIPFIPYQIPTSLRRIKYFTHIFDDNFCVVDLKPVILVLMISENIVIIKHINLLRKLHEKAFSIVFLTRCPFVFLCDASDNLQNYYNTLASE